MAGIVRMTHPRIRDRHVPFTQVGRMQQNGWTVAEDPPKRKRRPRQNSEPSEKDSGGSSLPETEEEK